MRNKKLCICFILSCFVFLFACRKEQIKVVTGEVSKIFPTNVTVTGRIISLGDGIKQYGHCYGKYPGPSISDNKTGFGAAIGLGEYTSYLAGLETGTKYYVKAYVSCSSSTVYGDEISFSTTAATLPEVTTKEVTDITLTSAVSGGEVLSDGGSPVIARGVCWSLSAGPTVANNLTSNATGIGSFQSNLNGLTEYTTYYVRAYATNGAGTSYGNEFNFTTAQ